jgi:hypothetical protein
MNESITFPEDKIRDIVRVIRRGLKDEPKRSMVRVQLEKQCRELEDYAKRLKE